MLISYVKCTSLHAIQKTYFHFHDNKSVITLAYSTFYDILVVTESPSALNGVVNILGVSPKLTFSIIKHSI